ncbi:hypothetical protein STRDD13_00214 [Streptococcus sp. DD13]|nr:hypothetical protein STRDD13_00214 [Streptococcus sp. DD13]
MFGLEAILGEDSEKSGIQSGDRASILLVRNDGKYGIIIGIMLG